MTLQRTLVLALLVILVAYIVTSPATASAGAADFGNWLLESALAVGDALVGLLGRLL